MNRQGKQDYQDKAIVLIAMIATVMIVLMIAIANRNGDCIMANCCCIKDIRWQDGVLQKYQNGEWSNVEGVGGEPEYPPVGESDIPDNNVSVYRCDKASAITSLIYRQLEGISNYADDNPDDPITVLAEGYASLAVNPRLSSLPLKVVLSTYLAETGAWDYATISTPSKVASLRFYLYERMTESKLITPDEMSILTPIEGFTSNEGIAIKSIWDAMNYTDKVAIVQAYVGEGLGDCTDIASSVFPLLGATVMNVGFEDSETDYFWTDTTPLTDLKRSGAKSAGYFANFPATSASAIFRVFGWTGEVSQVKLWCYRENHDETATGNIAVKVEGKLSGGSYITLADYYELKAENAWVQLTRGFTKDAWVDLQITVSVGSVHAIGIRVDDVEVS